MNIFEYNDFENDVVKYLTPVIFQFGLNITSEYNTFDKPVNNFVFLQNKNCIICLDNISSFPYPDITLTFYTKRKTKLIDINQRSLRTFLGITEDLFYKFINSHKENFKNKIEFKNNEKGAYLYGLKLTNDIINTFYKPIITGEIKFEDTII